MMSEARPSPVIAVDGGGTRCRLALDGAGGRHVVEAGAANVTSDFDAAIAAISAGLDALAAEAATDRAQLLECPAYLGLAGVTDAAYGEKVAAALPFRHARVEDDRRSALRGALGSRDGAIAHFGTGSFFAFQSAGTVRLAGGWGSRLGDEGSAFWVARCALSATLDVVDGLRDATPLTDRLLDEFGSPAGIVGYAATATPAAFGTLAPLVTGAAMDGDPLGVNILKLGADHIEHVITRMGWTPGMALCLTGGLGPAYEGYLSEPLAEALVSPDAPPIEGAVALAHDFASEVSP